jgi:transposase InsO family protein
MSRENRLWGTERIRGELLKLGIVVSNRSIRRYRWRGPAHSPSQRWRTLLRNHAHHLWAADLSTVPTLTFNALSVLVFIAHDRRELVHVNVTANPTAAWVWRQVIEATPWGNKSRHLLRDRDGVYGRDFRQRARRIGIDSIVTPVRAPRANAVVERAIGTLRRECLDHLIVLDEHRLLSVLGEFVTYYNQDRPHRTLRLQTPELKLSQCVRAAGRACVVGTGVTFRIRWRKFLTIRQRSEPALPKGDNRGSLTTPMSAGSWTRTH